MEASKHGALAMLAGLILIVSFARGWAEEPKSSQDRSQVARAEEPSAPVYKPPLRGAPGGRVG